MARERALSTAPPTPLRAAGRNEKRCIVRHALGFYRALIVTSLYSAAKTVDFNGIETFIPALKHCLATHPILNAAIKSHDTEEPQFVRPVLLNLRNHIRIIEPACVGHGDDDELSRLKHVLGQTHDQLFENCHIIPPWKVVVLPLHADPKTGERRFYIAFAYSHSHGDGMSGLAFHRSFLEGLQGQGITTVRYGIDPRYQTSAVSLPPSIEEVVDLPITNSYLLKPVLGVVLPKFVSGFLGLEASVTPQAPDMWRGKPASYNKDEFHTGMELAIIKDETLQNVLKACSVNGTKLTGLLHQIIVRALSEALPPDAPAKNFVGQTAINLRPMVPSITDADMANCVSVEYHLFPRDPKAHFSKGNRPRADSTGISREPIDPSIWAAARATTAALAARASTLENQPIGLLKHVPDFHKWLSGQIGKERDSSYELSNLLSFDPSAPAVEKDLSDRVRGLSISVVRPPTRSATTGSAAMENLAKLAKESSNGNGNGTTTSTASTCSTASTSSTASSTSNTTASTAKTTPAPSPRPSLSTQIVSPPPTTSLPTVAPMRRTTSLSDKKEPWSIGRVLFSQPASAVGPPVNFSVVTRRDGDMVVALTWQQGVLGLGGDESTWARRVCQVIREAFRGVASGGGGGGEGKGGGK